MDQKRININDKIYYYWEKNSELENTSIFIHGLGGDHRGLIKLTKEILNQRVIILDLPGYGLSSSLVGKHDLNSYAEFIEDFRKIINLKKFNLIGHSFGCAISLRYTEKFSNQIKILILINPYTKNTNTITSRMGLIYSDIAVLFPNKIAHFMLCNKITVFLTDALVMYTKDKQIRQKILDEDYLNYKRADIRALRDCLRELKNNQPNISSHYLFNIYIIASNHDSIVSNRTIELLAKNIKAKEVIYIESGHLLPLEQPELIYDTLQSLLSS